jgi:hypothetical protein
VIFEIIMFVCFFFYFVYNFLNVSEATQEVSSRKISRKVAEIRFNPFYPQILKEYLRCDFRQKVHTVKT